MKISEAQLEVHNWITNKGVKYFSPLTNMAILAEEVGEVARLMARIHGDQSFKENENQLQLADELADVLWVVMAIANQNEINLETSFIKNIEKKNLRDNNRHQQNEKLK